MFDVQSAHGAAAVTAGTKRILILNWRDPKHPDAGGAERYLLEVALQLREFGHRIHWMSAGFAGGSSEDSINGIPITRVGSRRTVYVAIPLRYLFRFRGMFDAIIDAENGIPFFSPLFTSIPSVCLVFHVHQRVFEKHLPFPISKILQWLEACAMPAVYRSRPFIAISSDTREELSTLGVPLSHIALAYSGYDERLRPGAKSTTPCIVYLGRLKKYKRVDSIIKAFTRVLQNYPEAKLFVAGSGDQETDLRRLASSLGVQKSVRFEGFISENRKVELLSSAWAFIMASEMEGWGLTVIEAGACGTPTVAVSVPGVREAVCSGYSGLLVESVADLPQAISRIFEDDLLRIRLSEGALSRASEFSWCEAARCFENALSA